MSRLLAFLAAALVSLVALTAEVRSSFPQDEKTDVFSGRVEAAEIVEIRARATGFLRKVHFKEGEEVKAGQLLFEIDPQPFEVEVRRAQAVVKQMQARKEAQENTVNRLRELVKRAAVSREEYNKAAKDLAEAEAGLEVARATLDFAQIQLEFTKVRAPISGRVGQSRLSAGNLVKADDTSEAMMLTTIVSNDRVYVYFDIDERAALRMQRQAQERKSKEVPVAIQLLDEKDFARKGKIDFVDNRINPKTGTLRVRAVIANTDGLLISGMSVRLRVGEAK
jgi:RND family efflux transporter MFP subunit